MNPIDIVIPAAGRVPDLLQLLQSLHRVRAVALRMAWGRLRLYAAGGFGSIPGAKVRTVVHDLVAPFALLAVTRWPALRRSVDARHRQPLGGAR